MKTYTVYRVTGAPYNTSYTPVIRDGKPLTYRYKKSAMGWLGSMKSSVPETTFEVRRTIKETPLTERISDGTKLLEETPFLYPWEQQGAHPAYPAGQMIPKSTMKAVRRHGDFKDNATQTISKGLKRQNKRKGRMTLKTQLRNEVC